MARFHGYVGLQKAPAMTDNQWNQFLLGFRNTVLGLPGNPGTLLSYRASLDGNAYILKASFDTSDITLEKFRQRLVSGFGVQDSDVTYTLGEQHYNALDSAFAAMKYQGTTMFYVLLFGAATDSGWPTRRESQLEVLAYLAANQTEWEAAEVE
jgi:hypothetical protein